MNLRTGKFLIALLLLVGTGLWPVVSGVTPETVVRPLAAISSADKHQPTTHDEVQQDVRATTPKARSSFQAGVVAYEAGQFELAAQAFRDSLAEQTTAETLLNLGLAEWRNEKSGAAMLAWEQAAWLNPLDERAGNNLSYVRAIHFISPLELTRWEVASTWLPASFWGWLTAGSLWLGVAMLTLPKVFRARKADWHSTLAALAWGIFILSLAPNFGVFTRAAIGIVTEKSTVLRLTPTQSAEIVATLPSGEPIRRLRVRGEFFYVHTQSGNGWIRRQEAKIICPE